MVNGIRLKNYSENYSFLVAYFFAKKKEVWPTYSMNPDSEHTPDESEEQELFIIKEGFSGITTSCVDLWGYRPK